MGQVVRYEANVQMHGIWGRNCDSAYAVSPFHIAPPPQNAQLQHIAANWARLTWEAVNASKAEVVKYQVHCRNSSSEWKQFKTTWLVFDLPLDDDIVEARVRAFHMLCNIRDSKILGEMSW
ncbi:unnamed protein product [Rodentolepis nana]|uniref:Fibronectin type-III domain-containing protein n=1 Tax=Rodentolepis nana TaxID=102285 RepID=A0A0R3U0H5_RODNA|nr:unnamed protein product [Rodentolepis nana]